VISAATAGAAFGLVPGFAPTQAAAPMAGRQAPGFYRYRLGAFEITVVTDGMNTNPLSDGYVSNQPRTAVNAALEADFSEGQDHPRLHADRGQHRLKLVAIDTGLGLGILRRARARSANIAPTCKRPASTNAVDTVIISHFHADHINGLVGPENKPAFPNAEVMVPAAEWAFWSDESNVSKLPEVARGQMGNPKRVFGVLGNKVTQYEAGKEIMPGITTVASYGHTPGHTSHVVASGNAKLLVQADVTAGAITLFTRNPDWQFVFDTDKPMAVATRKRLYDMAAADRMLVHGYHFPFPSLGYIEKLGSSYRLVPAPWNPNL
jgi:glyoxylase-like metal-dependent hydrolase (beta-lactamase superfamily II)